jgi:hypothetical protein
VYRNHCRIAAVSTLGRSTWALAFAAVLAVEKLVEYKPHQKIPIRKDRSVGIAGAGGHS